MNMHKMKMSMDVGKMRIRRRRRRLLLFPIIFLTTLSILCYMGGVGRKRAMTTEAGNIFSGLTAARYEQNSSSGGGELGGEGEIPEGYVTMSDTKTEVLAGDDRCVIVSCYDKNAPGIGLFWDYYKTFGYTLRRVEFGHVFAGGKRTVSTWCRIPAIMDALREYPNSRIMYLDIDTKVNPRVWCNLPDIKEHAPIIMNSFTRPVNKEILGKYSMYGAQVQANAFVVTSGPLGVAAMRRWEKAFDDTLFLHDQGVIHLQEKGLCGVPGWIQCYRNPNQQKCHCAAMSGSVKQTCIRSLFKGTKEGCHVSV